MHNASSVARHACLGTRLKRSVALGALLTALCAPALAQEVVQTTQPPAQEQEEEADRVIVTGTRLPNQFTSASPVDIIAADEAATRGMSDVAALLRSSTVAAGSPQITAVSSTAFVQDGGTGAETLSLRGLGANRTLVLLDGRRAGPAGTRGSVGAFDLNVIPLSAIERVEILKEGASSIYGSDAVAGVVNIITKKDDGATFDIFASAPLAGGGDEFRVNGSWGETYDNFRIRVTGDYYKQAHLKRGQRDFFQCATAYVFDNNGRRADIVDPRTGRYVCEGDSAWGHVWVYDQFPDGDEPLTRPWRALSQLVQFNYDNNLQNYITPFGPTDNGLRIPNGWFPVGYGEIGRDGGPVDPFYGPFADTSDKVINLFHPFQNNVSLSPEVERMTALVQSEYDVNDDMQLYAEALLNRRMTKREAYRQFWTYQYVYDYGGGTFVGDPLAISQGWTGDFVVWSPLSITDKAGETVTVDYMRFVAGARGNFGNDWTWEVSTQFSRSDGTYKDDIIFIDAVEDQEFRSSLCAGTTTRYRGAPCVDINWYDPNFLRGVFTPQEEAFLFGRAQGSTVYEQASVEAFITGEAFSLPAGPVGFVIGGLYQEDSIDDVPDQVIQDGEAWGDTTAGITRGEDTTSAAYLELAVPILRDVAFFDELSLTASGRYNDVESYGSESTYKAGLNWQISPEYRFRASHGTSFRSPALFELFLANETGFLRQTDIDVCANWGTNLAAGGITQRIADNCAADGIPANHPGAGADAVITSSGGFGTLEAETSTSTSIGFIWTPNFIDLQLSVDYFDIEVENEVTKLNAVNIVLGCYDSESFATEPLCNLITRVPAGDPAEFTISDVTDDFLNIATQTARGIDLDAVYRHEFALGDLTLHGQASYQLEDEVILLPTSEPLDFNGEIGDPKWVANFDATFDMDPFSFFWGIRYVGETSNEESYGAQPQTYRSQNVNYVLTTDAIVYHDISVAVEPVEGLTVRFGISNLFDEDPPFVTGELSGEYDTVGNVPIESQYDFFGRTIFLNISKSF